MYKLNKKYEVDRKILKCDYLRCSSAENSTKITPNSQIYINIPRENTVISLSNSYLGLYLKLPKNLVILDMETVRIHG